MPHPDAVIMSVSPLHFPSARELAPRTPVKAVETLTLALNRADQAIVEDRDNIQNFRTATVAGKELAQAVTALAQELALAEPERGPVTFRMSVEGCPRELHPMVRDDVHRIAHEALRNAFHHAQAAHIEAEVTYGARGVRLRVRDDGKGINPKELGAGRRRHWGLVSMRERAVQIGAQLALWSEVGAGTELELRVPGLVAYGASVSRRSLFRLGRKQGVRS
jgi:signal transduction histidine kinase